jgi:hypothetical protein
VTVAKNYLTADELTMLNLIVDQYRSFAELQARQRKPMYMGDWEWKLNDFLKLNERDIPSHAGKISSQLSEEIAHGEFEKYWTHRKESELAAVPELEKSLTEIRGRRKPKKQGPK